MYKVIALGFFIAIIHLTVGCSETKKSTEGTSSDVTHKVLELETYLSQLKAETRPHHFVDVRTPGEVADGTIEGATNIDYKADDFTDKIKALDTDKPMYLFCRSGNRSGKAAKILIDAGYKEIYDLKGGYLKYAAAEK